MHYGIYDKDLRHFSSCIWYKQRNRRGGWHGAKVMNKFKSTTSVINRTCVIWAATSPSEVNMPSVCTRRLMANAFLWKTITFTSYCSQRHEASRLIELHFSRIHIFSNNSQLQNAFQPLRSVMCDQSLCRVLSQPTSLTLWNEDEQGRQQGRPGTRVVAVDWFQIGSSGVVRGVGGWLLVVVVVGVQLAGLEHTCTHTLRPGPKFECVRLAPGVCWQNVCWQHPPPQPPPTPRLTPLQLVPSGYPSLPQLPCSTACPPSSVSLPGKKRGCCLPTFQLFLPFFLLHYLHPIISEPANLQLWIFQRPLQILWH